jgi:hypothetical protein
MDAPVGVGASLRKAGGRRCSACACCRLAVGVSLWSAGGWTCYAAARVSPAVSFYLINC